MNKCLVIIIVVILVTIGRFSNSIFLPSFPAMMTYFSTSKQAIQYTITFSMIAFGFFQLIYGPVSDYYGRRKVLLIGLSIFILGSIISVFAHTIISLWIGRIIQGAGVASTGIMARSITRDVMQNNKDFIKTMSLVTMMLAITPVFAPIIGGYVQEYLGWHWNFTILLVLSILGLNMVYFYLPETNFNINQSKFSLQGLVEKYKVVSMNKIFWGAVLIATLTYANEILYSVMAPFILQTGLGLSAVDYGWVGLFLISGLVMGSFLSSYLSKKIELNQLILIGLVVLCLSSVVFLLFALLHIFNLWVILVPVFISMFALGILYPNCAALAMLPFNREVGTASALYGAVSMISIGVATLFTAKLQLTTQLPLASLFMLFSLLAVLMYFFFVHRNFKHY